MKVGKVELPVDSFPISVEHYQPVTLDISKEDLTDQQVEVFKRNDSLAKRVIVLSVGFSERDGFGGHTAHGFSTTMERDIIRAIIRGGNNVLPYIFDTAGHGCIGQYADRMLDGAIRPIEMLTYRRPWTRLTGHPGPKLDPAMDIPGMPPIAYGRLDTGLPLTLGYAMAHKNQKTIIIATDGVAYEGTTWESIGDMISNQLNVLLYFHDNDMTIDGQRSILDPHFNLESMLGIDGLRFDVCENPDDPRLVYKMFREALLGKGPTIILGKRRIDASNATILTLPATFHDAIKADKAAEYLEAVGEPNAAALLKQKPVKHKPLILRGSTEETYSLRTGVGTWAGEEVAAKGREWVGEHVAIYYNDVAGSSGGKEFRKACIYEPAYEVRGIREISHLGEAAMFGAAVDGNVAFYTLFGPFTSMLHSIKRMIELSHRGGRALCNITHVEPEKMSDDTCHFGDNAGSLADSLREGDKVRILFPGDSLHGEIMTRTVVRQMINGPYDDLGMTFILTQRNNVPIILDKEGKPFFNKDRYVWRPGVADVIREGTIGYVVAVGAGALYNALDAVQRYRNNGKNVGLIYWSTFNTWSGIFKNANQGILDTLLDSPFVGVVEGLNIDTGLGMRMGTLLSERLTERGGGRMPLFFRMGVTKHGNGGQEGPDGQLAHQGLDAGSIYKMIRKYTFKA